MRIDICWLICLARLRHRRFLAFRLLITKISDTAWCNKTQHCVCRFYFPALPLREGGGKGLYTNPQTMKKLFLMTLQRTKSLQQFTLPPERPYKRECCRVFNHFVPQIFLRRLNTWPWGEKTWVQILLETTTFSFCNERVQWIVFIYLWGICYCSATLSPILQSNT